MSEQNASPDNVCVSTQRKRFNIIILNVNPTPNFDEQSTSKKRGIIYFDCACLNTWERIFNCDDCKSKSTINNQAVNFSL
jgi:hypothetical protein